jgi:2-polyprenyl-3-methyl-5-hydroxy-6-metoxy-1,4-benzoquinol methylase
MIALSKAICVSSRSKVAVAACVNLGRVRQSYNKGVGSVDFLSADTELERTLDHLDDANNYASWILDLASPYLGREVLEVGAGHGTMTELLVQRADRVVATDLSSRCTDLLRTRFLNESSVDVVLGPIRDAADRGPFDSAVLINVLEHIEEDDKALAELYDLLKPGGHLILWVPAFALLFSDFDRSIGHHRRYRRNDLAAQLARSGYKIVDLRYVNAVGAIAWFFMVRLAKRIPNRRAAMIFDSHVVPAVRRIEKKFHPPFGQSVFVVATRTGEISNDPLPKHPTT